MKAIPKKRLIYHSPNSGTILIGGIEYDGHLSDDNILGTVHEVGKTQWVNGQLWLVKDNYLIYRITVDKFYQYEKTWFELFLDWVRRI